MSPAVVQDWVAELPLMMQGTLMTGIRGPDIKAPAVKPLGRWLRSLVLVQGNPQNDFMKAPPLGSLPMLEDFEEELEGLPIHYFTHLMHCLEIVGLKHPDPDVSAVAADYYARLADWMHLEPERPQRLEERLSGLPGTTGSVSGWRTWYRDAVQRLRKFQEADETVFEDARMLLERIGYEVIPPKRALEKKMEATAAEAARVAREAEKAQEAERARRPPPPPVSYSSGSSWS